MGSFESQNGDRAKHEAERFHKAEKQWIVDNDIKRVQKNYLQGRYLQYLAVEYQKFLKTGRTKINDLEFLFGKAIDILARHILTTGRYIRENAETKEDYYDSAIDMVYKRGVIQFDESKGSAFTHFTTVISNQYMLEYKDKIKNKNMAFNQLKVGGMSSQISNLETTDEDELGKEFGMEYSTLYKGDMSVFEVELRKRFKVKPLKIIEDSTAPRARRTFKEYPLFLEVKTIKQEIVNDKLEEVPVITGLVIEYIDILNMNNESISKTHLTNRMKLARDNGYQYLAVYSDVYNDDEFDDDILFKYIADFYTMILHSVDGLGSPDIEDRYLGQKSYIPTDTYKMMSQEEPVWFFIDEKNEKRYMPKEQTEEFWNKCVNDNHNIKRIFDYGRLILA